MQTNIDLAGLTVDGVAPAMEEHVLLSNGFWKHRYEQKRTGTTVYYSELLEDPNVASSGSNAEVSNGVVRTVHGQTLQHRGETVLSLGDHWSAVGDVLGNGPKEQPGNIDWESPLGNDHLKLVISFYEQRISLISLLSDSSN